MRQVILPELGEGIERATVACWHAAAGDKVAKDDDIVEIVTDKATFNVPADADGIVQEIRFNEGDQVAVGEVLAVIEEQS